MMRTYITLTLFFLLSSRPLWAEDSLSSTVRGSGSIVPGSLGSTVRAGAAKPDPMLSTTAGTPADARATSAGPDIDPKLCDALTKHTPSADVAYQAGVDANGKPVAPADVPGSPQMALPAKINIPLTFSLAQVLNLDMSKYPYNQLGPGTEGTLGVLTVEGDRVSFNGQPLSDAQQDNLAVVCMQKK